MSEIRTRKWFLTIHENAESFHKFDDIIRQQERCSYAYIFHNADDDVSTKHIHVCIDFVNARSWTTIFRTFKGAHIEVAEHWHRCLRYLTHMDNPEKEQYSVSDVVKSYADEEFAILTNCDEFDYLSTENLIADIKAGLSLLDFVEKYGLHQVNSKHNLITKLLNEEHLFNNLQKRINELLGEVESWKILYCELKNRYSAMEDYYGYHYNKEVLKNE